MILEPILLVPSYQSAILEMFDLASDEMGVHSVAVHKSFWFTFKDIRLWY
jgi:hypothetical protein